jgi:very-short-patch-repair endonuclease
VSQSVLETRVFQLFRRAHLPAPIAQYQIKDRGRLIAIVDFAYPDARLAIEADGREWHEPHVRFQRDRSRGNRLTLLGWRVIHITWEDLTRRPDSVVETVKKALKLQS